MLFPTEEDTYITYKVTSNIHQPQKKLKKYLEV